MSKSSKITASELVLSAIFFLQQKNGVTAKDITKFICEKRGCRQSQVRSEVKRALERATENGIFSKKRGLYRIESGFGRNKISIKVKGCNKVKKMKKMKHSNSPRANSYIGALNAPEYSPAVEMPAGILGRQATYSMNPYTDTHAMFLSDGLENSVRKFSMEPTTCARNASMDDDDDEDDEDDFFEEDDDEDDVDYFADEQFPSASDAVKEYPPSDVDISHEEKKKEACKRKPRSRTKGRAKRRKVSKPKTKCRRKRNMVMRKNQKKTREPDSDEDIKQESNYGDDDDENIEQGSQGDYTREDDEDGQNEDDGLGGSEDDDDERNNDDYEDYDPSDEEYLIDQQEKKTKGKERSENKEGVAQFPGEGDQKQKPQDILTDIQVSQSVKVESKQNEIAPTAPATAPQQVSREDKSRPIRSSSLFGSFKKKNESKSSSGDHKIKIRM